MQLQTIVATLALCVQSAFAESYYITNPVAGAVWAAGGNVRINWIRNERPVIASPRSINIDLVDGPDGNARFVATVVANLPGTSTGFDFKVPTNVQNKADYFLRMAAVGADGKVDYNYSTRFSVTGGTGTVENAKDGKTNDKTSVDGVAASSGSAAQASMLGAAAVAAVAMF